MRLPFDHGAPPPVFAGQPRTTIDTGLIRVELQNGTVGWGESYGGELNALSAMFESRVAPLVLGRDALDRTLTASLERTLHNMGRSGLVLHALSGLDIALWDLRAKLEGVPLYTLLGGAKRTRISAYASLLQYAGDTELVRRNVARALEAGYERVKLHERTFEALSTARQVMGSALPLMIDTNCAWKPETATQAVRDMQVLNPLWVEEPIWPPEDLDSLIALRSATNVPIAAGENATSVHELIRMVRAHAVDYLQPSAIKAGGVTALLHLAQQCAGTAVRFSPQSAFLGPGLLATLHVLAAQSEEVAVEHLFCGLVTVPYNGSIPLSGGAFQLTDGPGLGADPERVLIEGGFIA